MAYIVVYLSCDTASLLQLCQVYLGILYLVLSVLKLDVVAYALMQSELNEYAAA